MPQQNYHGPIGTVINVDGGVLVVGGDSGLIYQDYAGSKPPRSPPLPWARLPPADAPFETFNLLSWKCRLSPNVIGRGGEMADLLAWARSGPGMRIRFLVGPGGAGKTRLGAELADALRNEGWHAGFAPLERETPLPISDKGLLLLLDYPEAWRQQVRKLLEESVRLEAPAAPIRLLLLSRRPLAEWQDDILQSHASALCDAQEIKIGALDQSAAKDLFRAVANRLARHRGRPEQEIDDAAVATWLNGDPSIYTLPLLITAAAIHFVDAPGETLTLQAVNIVQALVARERTRLDLAGRNAGWGTHAASRLIGLAALRDGLDAEAIRLLSALELEIGLPEPTRAVDAVRTLGWWQGDRVCVPPPDIIAAELLQQVLIDAGDRGPQWIWTTLSQSGAIRVELLDRRMHDIALLHRSNENLLLRENMVRAVAGRAGHAEQWRVILDAADAGFRLSPVGVAVANELLAQAAIRAEERAGILNNLSVRLSDAGDGAGGLAAIREAVEIRRPLARDNPARFAPDLAASLNNLSVHLSAAGDRSTGALAAIREAVEIRRRLAQDNPARFAPDLAQSLNNLSVDLSNAGDGAGALAAIREVVETYHRLAQENPARFAPDLATGLNNLSNRLSDAGDGVGALAAIREVVETYHRLAQENPARFAPDLATGLNNLSVRLSDAGDGVGAPLATRESVEIRRRLAQENPARFAPDFALSLNNLSVDLSNAGDGAGALAAIREAVEIRRPLARDNPARFAPDLAASLNNLSVHLSAAGDRSTGALAAIREAVEIRRRLAQDNPARFAPDLAQSLNNLSVDLSNAGDGAGALAAIREAVETYRRLAQDNPARFAPYLQLSLRLLAIIEKAQ